MCEARAVGDLSYFYPHYLNGEAHESPMPPEGLICGM